MTDPSAIQVNTFQRGHRVPFQAPSSRNSGRRISILIPSLYGGGAERVTTLLAEGLLARGHGVDLVLRDLICDYPGDVPAGVRLFFLSRFDDAEHRLNLEQLPVTPRRLMPARLPISLRFPRVVFATRLSRKQLPLIASTKLPLWATATATYLDRERPDALLAMLVPAVAAATMAARLARRAVRIVATGHDVMKPGRLLRRARRSYPYADAVVGVSRGVTAELSEISGLPLERTHTIYNPGVPVDLARKARESGDHPWLDDPAPPVILAIGRLREVKDFPTLLSAFGRLLTRCPARLIVLGEGPQRRNLLSPARKLQIVEHVDFPGFVKNPYAFLAKASLFALSSRHESLSNVLIEAMACGFPVVSTDCPFGPREILEGGRLGELVPVGDAEALAAAMFRTLDAPPQRHALQERAAYFNIERSVDQYERLLLEQ